MSPPTYYEYETKQGMLRYGVGRTTDEEISLTMTYSSYETGVAYETHYVSEDVSKIHKLFALDQTIILDIVRNNTLIVDVHVGEKIVSVHYKTEFMGRSYDVILTSSKKITEGVDPAVEKLQQQNNVLLGQISKLSDRLDLMDKENKELKTQMTEQLNKHKEAIFNNFRQSLLNKCATIGSDIPKDILTSDFYRPRIKNERAMPPDLEFLIQVICNSTIKL
jgi:hypothetical protein